MTDLLMYNIASAVIRRSLAIVRSLSLPGGGFAKLQIGSSIKIQKYFVWKLFFSNVIFK